tara:strand:- start:1357 stop:2067 length:711 start_codon:yes stop_codon:yes gene_type:complete
MAADTLLSRINSAVGIVAGVVSILLLVFAGLPPTVVAPIAFASAAILVIPLLVPFSLRTIPSAHAASIKYTQYCCWGLTMLLLVALIAAAMIWATLPDRVAASVGMGGAAISVQQTGEFKVEPLPSSTYRLTVPASAFTEWQQGAAGQNNSYVAVVGVIQQPVNPGDTTVRIIPAEYFFASSRGPIPVFEELLIAWLVILVVLEVFLLFLIPFSARVAANLPATTKPASDEESRDG